MHKKLIKEINIEKKILRIFQSGSLEGIGNILPEIYKRKI
jgi:hypothetical protein